MRGPQTGTSCYVMAAPAIQLLVDLPWLNGMFEKTGIVELVRCYGETSRNAHAPDRSDR